MDNDCMDFARAYPETHPSASIPAFFHRLADPNYASLMETGSSIQSPSLPSPANHPLLRRLGSPRL